LVVTDGPEGQAANPDDQGERVEFDRLDPSGNAEVVFERPERPLGRDAG
jgi:hypothetical protein